MVPAPAASASLRGLLEMQVPGPALDLLLRTGTSPRSLLKCTQNREMQALWHGGEVAGLWVRAGLVLGFAFISW